jgi:hypothetical protein
VTTHTADTSQISAGSDRIPGPVGLWYGLLAPPIAWLIQSLGSFWITTQACHESRGAGSARLVVIGLGLVALAVTLSALGASTLARRKLRESTAEPRRDMMALGGIFLAITLGLGVLCGSLPALILGKVCEATR